MLDKLRCAACNSKSLTFRLIGKASRTLRALKTHSDKNLSVSCNVCGVQVKTSITLNTSKNKEKDEHLLQLDDLYQEINTE